MHNKSFFQGLGLGIVIASVVFLILYSTRTREEINNYNVQETVAQTQTQTEGSVLLDLPEREEPATESSIEIQTIGEIQTINTEKLTISQEELSLSDDKVRLRIENGENASSVYKKMYDLGIIEDEKGFRDYVRENNLSTRRIGYGEYEIPKGASYKEIYEIIRSK